MASYLVSKQHQLTEKNVILAKQNPKAIEAGVFHNDVISLGDRNVFLYHEQAFEDSLNVIIQLELAYKSLHKVLPVFIPVMAHELS